MAAVADANKKEESTTQTEVVAADETHESKEEEPTIPTEVVAADDETHENKEEEEPIVEPTIQTDAVAADVNNEKEPTTQPEPVATDENKQEDPTTQTMVVAADESKEKDPTTQTEVVAENESKPEEATAQTAAVVADQDETKQEEDVTTSTNELKPIFQPFPAVDLANVPQYNPSRRLSAIEMRDMQQSLNKQMNDLIANPQLAKRRYTADTTEIKRNIDAMTKQPDLFSISEQLNQFRKEEEKFVPETIIDEGFSDTNLWSKITQTLSSTRVKVLWTFVIKKGKEVSHSVEFVHNQPHMDARIKTKRTLTIDGKQVLEEDTAKTEHVQMYEGNVFIICIEFNKDSKTWTYDLGINNKTHQQLFEKWKKKNVFVE
eukprot:263270_1